MSKSLYREYFSGLFSDPLEPSNKRQEIENTLSRNLGLLPQIRQTGENILKIIRLEVLHRPNSTDLYQP